MPNTFHLVILHGWSLDANKKQKWQKFRDELASRGITSDLLLIPGLSAPLNEVWDLGNFVEWLDKEIGTQEHVILLGHSFGGQIAVRYAATHPDKISRLILIDSSGIRNHSFMATTKRMGFQVLAKIGKVFFRSQICRNILYRLTRERDYQLAPPLLRRTMSQILDDEVVNDLPKIACPTLLIWGSDDQVTPLFLGQIFHAQIPHNRFHIITGARHAPQYTQPEQVAAQIQDFLFGPKDLP